MSANAARGIRSIAACKTSVSEYYASQNVMPADETEAGCATTTTQYCNAPTVANTGAVTVTATTVTGLPADCDMTITPDATASAWTGSTTCDEKYVASNFR